MIETNIRILRPGPKFYLDVRRAPVIAQDLSPDLLWKACNSLRYEYGLAAVPSSRTNELLVATQNPLEPVVVKGDDWRVEVRDGGSTQRLCFAEPGDLAILTRLVERSLLIEVHRRTDLWVFPGEPRIWYESEPFLKQDGFAAYSRFEISAIPIEGVGIGLIVDIGTAFFTTSTIADFFQQDLPKHEQQQRENDFRFLSQRQRERKGTLLYDLGKKKHKKCYFVEFLPGITCATTSTLTVEKRDYASLFEYYRAKHPQLEIKETDPVAKVSFSNMGRPVPVAANKLYLRVMNQVLPDDLKQIDKIEPSKRAELIEDFWEKLNDHPLGLGKPNVERNFWQPGHTRAFQLQEPKIVFPNKVLYPPNNGDARERKDYFGQRRHILRDLGCLEVPAVLERNIHFAIPTKAGEEMATKFTDDIVQHLSIWTKKNLGVEEVAYDNFEDAISKLRKEPPGMVVFVFDDDDPSTYFEVSHELRDWRVQHVTYQTLEQKFNDFESVEKDNPVSARAPRAVRDWRSFTEFIALEVLQHLGCVPWSVEGSLQYEGRLVIDVGEDGRHFSLTLLICRPKTRQRSFWLDTIVIDKSDPKTETINAKQLFDNIRALFKRLPLTAFAPLSSLLVERDGRECGDELKAIDDVTSELMKLGYLEEGAQIDIVDFHKKSVKNIRIWDRDQNNIVWHAPEGTAVVFDEHTLVLTNTGAATLHQGTAEPMMLIAQGANINMVNVATAVHATTHLNWSSPNVAQRLPLELKRTDDALERKAKQEIRLYK